tara:strand:+ start:393 stop:581 length:189 start_codon:yes stop_codon:yes gene_type:complete
MEDEIKFEYFVSFVYGGKDTCHRKKSVQDIWDATCGSEIMSLVYNCIPDDCEEYTILMINKL